MAFRYSATNSHGCRFTIALKHVCASVVNVHHPHVQRVFENNPIVLKSTDQELKVTTIGRSKVISPGWATREKAVCLFRVKCTVKKNDKSTAW